MNFAKKQLPVPEKLIPAAGDKIEWQPILPADHLGHVVDQEIEPASTSEDE